MSKTNKACPLLSVTRPTAYADCIEDRCAWFHSSGACAMTLIAGKLRKESAAASVRSTDSGKAENIQTGVSASTISEYEEDFK